MIFGVTHSTWSAISKPRAKPGAFIVRRTFTGALVLAGGSRSRARANSKGSGRCGRSISWVQPRLRNAMGQSMGHDVVNILIEDPPSKETLAVIDNGLDVYNAQFSPEKF